MYENVVLNAAKTWNEQRLLKIAPKHTIKILSLDMKKR